MRARVCVFYVRVKASVHAEVCLLISILKKKERKKRKKKWGCWLVGGYTETINYAWNE